MYKGQSNWELEKDRITFFDFYNDEDYNLSEFLTEEHAKKFLIKISCPIYVNVFIITLYKIAY